MNEITVPLNAEIAEAIVITIANTVGEYSKSWSWWAHNAKENYPYSLGAVQVRLVQRINPEDTQTWGGEFHGDPGMELVFEIEGRHFQITGEYSSYSSDSWNTGLREVRPTKVTRQVFQAI